MKKFSLIKTVLAMLLAMTLCMCTPAFSAEVDTAEAGNTAVQYAEEEEDNGDKTAGTKAVAAAIAVGLASTVGSLSMGLAISKSAESMARQPEAAGKINSAMMLGLVFIETLIIYALIVAILIIFVL